MTSVRTQANTAAHTALLAPLGEAVRTAGAVLRTMTPPAPATEFEEFRTAFETLEEPVAAVLRRHLTRLRPGTAWADEFEDRIPRSGEVWVVDPIDGAVQLLQGLPQFAVSVALVSDGEPVAAALHAPLLDETYLAAVGTGATRNGRTVSPSLKTDPAIAVVATSQPPFITAQPSAASEAGRSLAAVLPSVAAVRNLGPTSWQIADTAAGRLDAFWEFGRDDTNLAAGALIAREAGALVTDAEGRPWHIGAPSFLAASPHLHPAFVQLLGKAG